MLAISAVDANCAPGKAAPSAESPKTPDVIAVEVDSGSSDTREELPGASSPEPGNTPCASSPGLLTGGKSLNTSAVRDEAAKVLDEGEDGREMLNQLDFTVARTSGEKIVGVCVFDTALVCTWYRYYSAFSAVDVRWRHVMSSVKRYPVWGLWGYCLEHLFV